MSRTTRPTSSPLPALDAEAVLRRRCRSMLSDHRRRAARDFQAVPYTAADLMQLVRPVQACAYCGAVLSVATFSLDHARPLSRGGHHTTDNLRVVCPLCQERKGALCEDEFRALLLLVSTWPPAAGTDLLRRLRAGGRRYSTSRKGRARG